MKQVYILWSAIKLGNMRVRIWFMESLSNFKFQTILSASPIIKPCRTSVHVQSTCRLFLTPLEIYNHNMWSFSKTVCGTKLGDI